MEYRTLGKSGLQVSQLSFGTMTFGGIDFFKEIGGMQVDDAREMVDLCLEAGINLFDTADIYSNGLAEEILGAAIGSERRNDVIIATKAFGRMGLGVHDTGLSRRHLIQACEASLRRLKTDYIDLYQVHSWDGITPIEETLSALDSLIQSGKVRYIGCSNYCGWQLMKALGSADKHNYQRYISQQVHYSLYTRDLEHELIPLAVDQNVGTLVWSPLSFGLLSGKYARGKPMPEGTRLSTIEILGPTNWEKVYAIRDALEKIALSRSKTIAQVALNWVLQRPTVSSVIFGARTPAQLHDNLGAIGWNLTAEEIASLVALTDERPPYPLWHQHSFGADRHPLVVER